jgi:hypothetical protein
VAVILAIYLDVDGYTVSGVTTFGQPKVTDRSGADKFKHIPITRVVNEMDMVPLVPHSEATLLELPGIYWHLGEEIGHPSFLGLHFLPVSKRCLVPVLGASRPESIRTTALTCRNCVLTLEGGHQKSVKYFRGAVKDALGYS